MGNNFYKCTKQKFIHLLTAILKNSHVENSKNHKGWYCPHHTDCVSMCCWIVSPFVTETPCNKWLKYFRGIAISPILSKVFEYCVLDRFSNYFCTTDNQFGFKKGVGCSFAIRTVGNIVDSYIRGGSTAYLCAIDLSKAFDKVNHHALFLKLMRRHIPTNS